jgi:serine protease Do
MNSTLSAFVRLFMLRHAWILSLLLPSLVIAAENRDTKVINDRSDVLATGKWIYNDLSKGFSEAQRTGKPLLVVFRCIP